MADAALSPSQIATPDSVALARLIAEVKGPGPLQARAHYNRTHNRHNR